MEAPSLLSLALTAVTGIGTMIGVRALRTLMNFVHVDATSVDHFRRVGSARPILETFAQLFVFAIVSK